jgi:hypothetical protein
MPTITYDGQSFMIDGRRVWLVAGTIEYTRLPRDEWAERIALAKRAGLNTISTSVVWSRHEPRPGAMDFAGHNDLRYFVELLKAAGMYGVLRIGPYVGNGFDLGGLPPWLLTLPNATPRTASGPFLEACSRFIGAVAKQVRDLQATSPQAENDRPGPIILVQNEQQWTCGHEALALNYLGELHRYIRESGFEVPISNTNDLWQGVEGEIDTWTGSGSMLPSLRQLAVVRPSQPRVVGAFRLGEPAVWGGKATEPASPEAVQRGLCEILAAAGQFNIEPIAGGTNLGFSAGRSATGPADFIQTSDDRGAPIGEDGSIRPAFAAVRRVSMFASRFGRLFAHLDPKRPTVTLMPRAAGEKAGGRKGRNGDEAGNGGNGGPIVVHASGTQGSVAFVFAPPRKPGEPAPTEPVPLLLPDGSELSVYLGDQPVTWVVLDHRLVGRSQLDYCNLPLFALAGRVLVVSGPAGATARLSVNGSDLQAIVPDADDPEPLLLDHEGVLIMLIADARLETLHVGSDAVYLDVDGLTLEDEPIVQSWGQKFRKISGDAILETVVAEQHPKRPVPKVEVKAAPLPLPKGKAKAGKKGKGADLIAPAPVPLAPLPPTAVVVPAPKPLTRVSVSEWHTAAVDEYLDGSGPRYAATAGPADLNVMGAAYGYGWYRVRLKTAHKARIALPKSGDRLNLFVGGEPVGVLGMGPGAAHDAVVPLAKNEPLVILAENLGRFAGGANLGEPKGVVGPIWEVHAARTIKPTVERGAPVDVLSFRAPLWRLHPGDATDPMRLTWVLPHKGKHPVIVRFDPRGHRGILLLNDKPLKYFDASGPSEIVLTAAELSRGNNTIQAAVIGTGPAAMRDLADALSAQDCVEELSTEAEWSFAKWDRPVLEAFEGGAKRASGTPHWHRATFSVPHAAPLALDTAGLSKGQAYVNGHHLGRYFTATSEGKAVGPQTRLHVPAAFLLPGHENEIVLFDEHGFAPTKVRLVPVTRD